MMKEGWNYTIIINDWVSNAWTFQILFNICGNKNWISALWKALLVMVIFSAFVWILIRVNLTLFYASLVPVSSVNSINGTTSALHLN